MRAALRRALVASLLVAATAWATSDAVVFPPEYPPGASEFFSGSANQLRCAILPADKDLSSGTILTLEVNTGAGGATCGVAIYPNSDGGTAIASASAACTATGVFQRTGLTAFNLTGGTLYRVCVCSTSTVTKVVAMSSSTTGTDSILDLLNTFSTAVGTAANSCSAGVPPSTTGAITASTTFLIPIVVADH